MCGDISALVTTLALAAGQPVGSYCHPIKVLGMLLLALPWMLAGPWVQKEARRVLAGPVLWSASVLAVGTAALLLWLLIPMYLLGLVIYAVLSPAMIFAFVVYRDSRVDPQYKILSREHISSFLAGRKSKKIEVVNRLKVYNSDGKVVISPDAETADEAQKQTYNLAQEFLYDLLWRRASEADLAPVGQQTRVRYVIDGVAVERPALGLAQSEAIIQYLKPLGGMSAEDRRRPQQGKIAVDVASRPVDIIITTAGTTGGQRMQFRVVQESIRTSLNDLGMSQDVLRRIQEIAKSPNGLVIVSGRPGSGVTSTLYSLLRHHDAYIKHLMTLESQAEVDLENITQNQYKEPQNLPGLLVSALRRDPDVVMVDRCGDARTAEIIRQAAAEKNILLGMQAGDTFVALAKWVKLCGEPAAAMKPIRALLCQVLLRKLCHNCREAYRPDPNMLAKANLPAQKIENFYRPPTKPLLDEKGRPVICPSCQASGYVGRTAAFELLEVTDELRSAVAEGASLTEIKKLCRKNKMLYLQEQALRKVIEGETSIQEVLRVSQPQQKR